MRRGAEDDSHGPPAKRRNREHNAVDPGVPQKLKHAFKVLLPNDVAASLLGSKAAMKEDIQSRTGTKLVFSNRNDYFPKTQMRVLGIFCDVITGIHQALEEIVPKVAELAEEERKSGKGDGKNREHREFEIFECLHGKEIGEYVFRLCITQGIAGLLIGSGGANIKGIRRDSGAKVFIENDTEGGHRLVRIIGGKKEILKALEQLNAYVQQEADQEDFFSSYASVINFGALLSEDGEHSRGPIVPERSERRSRGGGKGSDRAREQQDRRDQHGSWEERFLEEPIVPRQGGRGSSGASTPSGVREGLDHLADVIKTMPERGIDLLYALNCRVPAHFLDSVEKSFETIMEETGVELKIMDEEDDSGCLVSITGSIPRIYSGHSLLLQRVYQLKDEEQGRNRGSEDQAADPEELKRQIQELEARLKSASKGRR